jgi:hypothetical protein
MLNARLNIAKCGIWCLTIVIVIAVYWLAHSTIDGFYCVDEYYHIKLAEHYRANGLKPPTHWFSGTLQATHFADKEWLFHLLLIPFVSSNLYDFSLIKVFGVLLVLCIGAAFCATLSNLGCRPRPVLILLLLFASPEFFQRTILIRPHLINISVTLLVLSCIVQKQPLRVLGLCALLGMSYSVPLVPVLIALLEVIINRAEGHKGDYRCLLAALLGSVGSQILHPHFPHNIITLWYQTFGALGNTVTADEWSQADEMLGIPSRAFLRGLWMPCLLLVYQVSIMARTGHPVSKLFVVLGLFFAGVTMWSIRGCEMFIPLCILGFAFSESIGKSTYCESRISVSSDSGIREYANVTS